MPCIFRLGIKQRARLHSKQPNIACIEVRRRCSTIISQMCIVLARELEDQPIIKGTVTVGILLEDIRVAWNVWGVVFLFIWIRVVIKAETIFIDELTIYVGIWFGKFHCFLWNILFIIQPLIFILPLDIQEFIYTSLYVSRKALLRYERSHPLKSIIWILYICGWWKVSPCVMIV